MFGLDNRNSNPFEKMDAYSSKQQLRYSNNSPRGYRDSSPNRTKAINPHPNGGIRQSCETDSDIAYIIAERDELRKTVEEQAR